MKESGGSWELQQVASEVFENVGEVESFRRARKQNPS